MRHDIAFLHTSAEHIATFTALMASLAPELRVRHDVDERLLAEARADGGIGPELRGRVIAAMEGAGSTGARVVVCTCSTVGEVAEDIGQGSHLIAQRVDRAMAEAAVQLSSKILIVATLQSTIAPTRSLIYGSAARIGKHVSVVDLVVENAWPYFERSLTEAYLNCIASAVKASAQDVGVVVLAQASMAGVVEHCRDLEVPVLASPRLGARAAVKAYWALSQSSS